MRHRPLRKRSLSSTTTTRTASAVPGPGTGSRHAAWTLRIRQRPACRTRDTVDVLLDASFTVAVAVASPATVTFCTVSLVAGENRLRRTSWAQLPLFEEAATDWASLGVKICVQIRLPSPA